MTMYSAWQKYKSSKTERAQLFNWKTLQGVTNCLPPRSLNAKIERDNGIKENKIFKFFSSVQSQVQTTLEQIQLLF